MQLIKGDDPMLRLEAPPFDFANPPTDPVKLAEKMQLTMAKLNGLGLSCCQVGLPYRMFTFADTVAFNPLIVGESEEKVVMEEGCLSFPDLFIKIKRPTYIRARLTDQYGNVETKQFMGMTARIFQHECDHMDGILFMDRANRYHLQMAYRHRNRLRKQKENHDRLQKRL